jgi:hypothetical protein
VRRNAVLRGVAGVVLLALALGVLLLARGVSDAASSAEAWRHGTPPAAVAAPGRLQTAGERLLGIEARSDLQRAYTAYRVGLADVIPGTTYPQTQARWNALRTVGRLRASLPEGDRAAADLLLGRVYAETAAAAGPTTQRQTLRDDAIAALRRAALEDPAGAEPKHDLEVLLAAAGAARARRDRSSGRTPSNGRPAASPHAESAGSGY